MQTPPRASPLSHFLLFLPPFFWSTNFIVGKALVGQVPPWTLNTGRFVVSALILSPLLFYRAKWPPIPRQTIAPLIFMSLTGVFAFNSFLYMGLRHTTAINATLVNCMIPVITSCLAWLLIGERMSWRRGLGTALSFAGVAWIVSRGSLETLYRLSLNPGDLLVFVATVLWGLYSVAAKRTLQHISPLAATAITTWIGALLLLPVAFVELSWSPADLWRKEVLFVFLYLGILPSFVALLIWNRSVLIFGPGRATLVYNTIPLFAVILSVTFLRETLMPYQVVGGLAVIAGVILGTTDQAA